MSLLDSLQSVLVLRLGSTDFLYLPSVQCHVPAAAGSVGGGCMFNNHNKELRVFVWKKIAQV